MTNCSYLTRRPAAINRLLSCLPAACQAEMISGACSSRTT